MAKNTVHDYARALYETTHDLKGNELKKALESFTKLLYKHSILKNCGAIIKAYESLVKKKEGIKSITITTARELDDRTLKEIKKAFGGETEASTKVDESLLGGLIVQTDDTILDASLRTQLRNLQEQLV